MPHRACPATAICADDRSCAGPDDEYAALRRPTHAALIGANTEPDVSGDAPDEVPYAQPSSCTGTSTAAAAPAGRAAAGPPTPPGLRLARRPDLVHVLTSLDADTVFAIGPTDWLLTSVRPARAARAGE
ncbi:MAG: hypothetical protein R2713_03945 [Ilumatobacteraceae bacterium]